MTNGDLFEGMPLGYEAAVLGLGKDQCRWPHGDPDKSDFHFCTAKQSTTQKTLYCDAHAWDSRHVKGGKRPAEVTRPANAPPSQSVRPAIPPFLTNNSPAKNLSPAVAAGVQ